MRKLFGAAALVSLAACGSPDNRLMVSPEAEDLGGNLFIETLDDGGQVLVLDGEITPDTAYTFQFLLMQADIDGLVLAQSPGGDLIASHIIGRALERAEMNTLVLESCRSACVDVFIAGRERSMTSTAELGLHSAQDREFGLSIDRPYWASFGLSVVNEAAYKVPFGDIWIVDAERALELRLATEILE